MGIICLLMLTIPAIPALNVFKQEINKEVTSGQNEGRPDLVIKTIKHDYWYQDGDGWFEVYVVNDGEGDVPGGSRTETVIVYYDFLLLPFVSGDYRTENSYGSCTPIPPGEEDIFWADDFGIGFDTLVRIAFWVNPKRDITESNYENNGIWGLYITKVIDSGGRRHIDCDPIGDLHQWITDGNPPWWYPDEYIEYNQYSYTSQQTSNFNVGMGGITNE